LGAGAWFILQGETGDRINITLNPDAVAINEKVTLIAASIRLTNAGKRSVHVNGVEVWCQRILPPPESFQTAIEHRVSVRDEAFGVVRWPILDEASYSRAFEIAPTESADIYVELFIPRSVKIVKLYAKVPNEKGAGYWDAAMLVRTEKTQ
jgi:hypothetical protein